VVNVLVGDQNGIQPGQVLEPFRPGARVDQQPPDPVSSSTQEWPKWVISTTTTVLQLSATVTRKPATARTDSANATQLAGVA
jgi:hypothetical protein